MEVVQKGIKVNESSEKEDNEESQDFYNDKEDENHSTRGFQSPSLLLDVPRFNGDDPYSWIFQIEEYFSFHNIPESQHLQIVAFHMDGKASSWFQWLKNNGMLSKISWAKFLQKIRFRFGSSLYDDHEGELAKLSQRGTVEEFQAEFEALMNKVQGVSEALLISFFISGLKIGVRCELQLNRPSTLEEAFALARMFEGEIMDNQSEGRSTARNWNRLNVPITYYR